MWQAGPPFRIIPQFWAASLWVSPGFCEEDRASRPDVPHGVPVLTNAKLEQVIPCFVVVSVESTPTFPALPTVAGVVTVIAGSVIGCDTENNGVTVFWEDSHAFQVAATGVARVKFIVSVPVVPS